MPTMPEPIEYNPGIQRTELMNEEHRVVLARAVLPAISVEYGRHCLAEPNGCRLGLLPRQATRRGI